MSDSVNTRELRHDQPRHDAYLTDLARRWADELDSLAGKQTLTGRDRAEWMRTVRGKLQGVASDLRRFANRIESSDREDAG